MQHRTHPCVHLHTRRRLQPKAHAPVVIVNLALLPPRAAAIARLRRLRRAHRVLQASEQHVAADPVKRQARAVQQSRTLHHTVAAPATADATSTRRSEHCRLRLLPTLLASPG